MYECKDKLSNQTRNPNRSEILRKKRFYNSIKQSCFVSSSKLEGISYDSHRPQTLSELYIKYCNVE